MNDLATHLRNSATDWDGLPGHDDEEIIHYITCKKAREIADHIEAQENLINELAACLQWMVDNDETNEGDEPLQDYGGKTWNELNEYWIEGLNRARSAISKASKSNPNTPERNDE